VNWGMLEAPVYVVHSRDDSQVVNSLPLSLPNGKNRSARGLYIKSSLIAYHTSLVNYFSYRKSASHRIHPYPYVLPCSPIFNKDYKALNTGHTVALIACLCNLDIVLFSNLNWLGPKIPIVTIGSSSLVTVTHKPISYPMKPIPNMNECMVF
jgi:hypothetical protein